MHRKLELQEVQEDGLGPWVTLDEVGGNLDAVQPRSAGPGVEPSASQAAVPAALFSRGVQAWNPPAVVLCRSVPRRCRLRGSGCRPGRALWDPFEGGYR